MVELTTIFGLTQTLAIIVGVIVALMELRHMRQTRDTELETRQAQLFMQIFTRHFEIDTRKSISLVKKIEYEDYDDYVEKYGEENDPEVYHRINSLGTYYEGIGVLVKRNLVDPSMVDDLMSGRIIDFWEMGGRWIKEYRQRTGDYEAAEHVEYLYNVIKNIRDKQRTEAGLPIQ